MPGLTYTTYVSSIANLLVVPVSDPYFLEVVPNIIDDAELRIYRELDLLASNASATSAMTAGNRNFTLPSTNGTFVVVESINVITPVATVDPELGTRNPVMPTSIDVLNAFYPSVNGSTVPVYFSRDREGAVVFGPWPNAAYTVEVIGTIRPAALSSSTITSVLSVYFPDLFVAASMVFGAAYQKNFGSAVDDPKAAVTWESHYQMLLKAAATEENRKKFEGAGWSPSSPSPEATPPRT
jgi:hypothetical protein